MVSRVGLLLLDEIHLLNDPGRGPTLEAVVARMRTLSQSAEVRGTPIAALRSVSLSATISNHEDIARWLDGGCVVKAFDETYRPVPLQRSGMVGREALAAAEPVAQGSRRLHAARTATLWAPDKAALLGPRWSRSAEAPPTTRERLRLTIQVAGAHLPDDQRLRL